MLPLKGFEHWTETKHEYTTLYQLLNTYTNVSFLPLLATPLSRRPYLLINLRVFIIQWNATNRTNFGVFHHVLEIIIEWSCNPTVVLFYFAVGQLSPVCFNCGAFFFRLCFLYKNVNVMTHMCMWGWRSQSAHHISCCELKKLVAGAKTKEFSWRVTNHTIE
jgi:hypothetical protein